MKYKIFSIGILSMLITLLFQGCDKIEPGTPVAKPVYDMSGFARGADVSWLTEMEKSGVKFYDRSGRDSECITLLRDLGVNAIRLRVWVDPEDGWCNKGDFLVKAYRAHNLGMRLMVDFHYSDSWADPGQQTKPRAWAEYSVDELCDAVGTHTTDVLSALREQGIEPEWVQVGNETGNGMLWDEGKADISMANYARLNNAGYDAVKTIFPQSKVIVHLEDGDNMDKFNWLFGGLKANGGKWDVAGMSLYPEADTWRSMTTSCLENMRQMIATYGCDVMVCEVGMAADQPETCKEWLETLMTGARAIDGCLGVFYWEPQSYANWKAYGKGAFDDNGMPTVVMDAFSKP